jgi:hypothetical protein
MISNSIILIVLHDGFPVKKAFYDLIRVRVEEIIPALQPGITYTLQTLCGEDFWQPLTPVERSVAGRCMANMVRESRLPLAMVGCEHQSPKKYVRI